MRNSIILPILICTIPLFILLSCTKKENKTNQLPTCIITSPKNGHEYPKGDPITISVNAYDNDGSIVEVRFFIDDIGIGFSNMFPYNYQWDTGNETGGYHKIKAISIDNDGGTAGDEITITLTTYGTKPIADFSAQPTTGNVPFTVEFNDESSYGINSWNWDFGDGNTSTDENPSNLYLAEGKYTVTLIVTNYYSSDTAVKAEYINAVPAGGGGEPCPGIPNITWQGQVYHTVKIGAQCWLRENLNWETGNSWCAEDDPANCEIYGRLYDWETMMNGDLSSNSVPSGVQGICPDGWHIPSDNEWKILEGSVDSQFPVGDSVWDLFDNRGYDVGTKLKSTTGWPENAIATNESGFSVLPGGYRDEGYYAGVGISAWLWSATQSSNNGSWYRAFWKINAQSFRDDSTKVYGMSARCLKD